MTARLIICDFSFLFFILALLITPPLRATLVAFLTFSVVYYDQNVPRAFPALLGAPSFTLINNMSCYVYRHVRLGLYRDASIRSSVIIKALGGLDSHPNHSSYNQSSSRPTETTYSQSIRDVDQEETGIRIEGDLYELEIIHTNTR